MGECILTNRGGRSDGLMATVTVSLPGNAYDYTRISIPEIVGAKRLVFPNLSKTVGISTSGSAVTIFHGIDPDSTSRWCYFYVYFDGTYLYFKVYKTSTYNGEFPNNQTIMAYST